MSLRDFFGIYLLYLLILNGVAIFVYYFDKRKAKNKKWRTPEKVLLGISVFGGCYTGYLSMFLFRHKTNKWYFHVVNWIGLILHTTIIVWFLLRVQSKTIDKKHKKVYIKKVKIKRMWRNWQTRQIQVLMGATSCRFKSCYPHQTRIIRTLTGSRSSYFLIRQAERVSLGVSAYFLSVIISA